METTNKRLKIAYLTFRDATDKREWSGTLYYMAQSLSKHAGEVHYIGPYKPSTLHFFLKVFKRLNEIFLRKKYSIAYSYILALFYKIHFSKKIKQLKPDIIFAASAAPEMSLLKLDHIPIVYLGDVTFELLPENYPNFTNLSQLSLFECDHLERKAFNRANALVFSSKWAVDSALQYYRIPENKIHLISYGANMDKIPETEEISNKTIGKKLKLLFLGVDWNRKGGKDVFEAFEELLKRGIDAQLTVCGCIPPVQNPNMVVHKFLNKNKADDFKILYNILLDTHFLFVPSKSDCTPIVFCEASAFGIPVITSNVGGITSVVKERINGHTFPLETTKEEYAKLFESYYSNPDKYRQLSASSRKFYESNLNWDVWGKKMYEIFEQLCKK